MYSIYIQNLVYHIYTYIDTISSYHKINCTAYMTRRKNLLFFLIHMPCWPHKRIVYMHKKNDLQLLRKRENNILFLNIKHVSGLFFYGVGIILPVCSCNLAPNGFMHI